MIKRVSRSVFDAALATLLSLVIFAIGFALLIWHPQTPLPDAYNPVKPLDPLAAWSSVSSWKLARTAKDAALCHAALARADVGFQAMPPLENGASCGIQDRIALNGLPGTRLRPFETSCPIALHLSLWLHHDLQPLARRHLGEELAGLDHFGSYSCRTIAGTNRMSQHARGNAIDIAGFRTKGGKWITLKRNWSADDSTATFLSEANRTACNWFNIVLGPDYNAAHADHFHLDLGRWRSCR